MGLEKNMQVVSDAHKIRLPSGKFTSIIVNRMKKTNGAILSYLICRREVSEAIEYLRHNNPDYSNVENSWAEEDERWISEAELLRRAGLEEEAPEDPDVPDVVQVGDEDDEDDEVLRANLEHLGHTGQEGVPYTASTLLEETLRTARTDLEIFQDNRVEALPRPPNDREMESKPFPG